MNYVVQAIIAIVLGRVCAVYTAHDEQSATSTPSKKTKTEMDIAL